MTVIKTGPLRVNTLIVPLNDNKVFIVDPACCEFSRDENIIVDFLKEKNLEPKAIILTHGHFDHISGLKILKKNFPNIPILIHKEDLECIGENSEVAQGEALYLMGFDIFLPYVSELPNATSCLEDGKTLSECLNSDCEKEFADWKIIHTPGHTKGCICLFNEKENLLISGDTVFYHSWGRTDLPGGSEKTIQESLKKIFSIINDQTKIYPGHERTGFTKKD